VDVTWNNVMADSSLPTTSMPRGRIAVRDSFSRRDIAHLDVAILSVRGWRTSVTATGGSANADIVFPYGLANSIVVASTRYYPHTANLPLERRRVLRAQWTLPANVSSPSQTIPSRPFDAEYSIHIAPTDACTEINGRLWVRAINWICPQVDTGYFGAFRNIAIRRIALPPSLDASETIVTWRTETPINFTAHTPVSADRYEWVVDHNFTTPGTFTTYIPNITLTHRGFQNGSVRVRALYCGDRESEWVPITVTVDPATIPIISGPTQIFGNVEEVFQIRNLPSISNTRITWSSNENIQIIGPINQPTVRVRRASPAILCSSGWLTAIIEMPGYPPVTLYKSFTVAPTLFSFGRLCGNATVEFDVVGIPSHFCPNHTLIEWESSNNITILPPLSTQSHTSRNVRRTSSTENQGPGWVRATINILGELRTTVTKNIADCAPPPPSLRPLTLSGPTALIGFTEAEYEIRGIPYSPNTRIYWSSSPNIRIVGPIKRKQATTIRVRSFSPTHEQEPGWVSATVQVPGYLPSVTTINVNVSPTVISGPFRLCGHAVGEFEVMGIPPNLNAQISWTNSPNIQFVPLQNKKFPTIRARRLSPANDQGAGSITAIVEIPGMQPFVLVRNIEACPPPVLSISGPTQLCGSIIGKYEITGLSSGSNAQISWTGSNNILILDSEEQTATNRAMRVSPTLPQESGWITATVEIPEFLPIVVTRNIQACPLPSISGPVRLCGSSFGEFEIMGIPFGSNAQVHWTTSPNIQIVLIKSVNYHRIRTRRASPVFPQESGWVKAIVQIPGLPDIVLIQDIENCPPPPEIIPTLNISGPTLLCGSIIGDYQLLMHPYVPNTQVRWSSSWGIQILNPQEQALTNRARRTSPTHDQGAGWIAATVDVPGMDIQTIFLNIVACPPPPTLSISGPTQLCGHTIGEFEVMGISPNLTQVSWTSSANIRPAFPEKKNPRILRAIRTSPTHDQGAGWVRATVEIPGFQPIVVTRNIVACPPPPPVLSISGPTQLCGNVVGEFEVMGIPFGSNARIRWTSSSCIVPLRLTKKQAAMKKQATIMRAMRFPIRFPQTEGWIRATVEIPGLHQPIVVTKNIAACAPQQPLVTPLWRFDIPEFSMLFDNVIVFPNPADNTLVIDLTQQTEADLLDVQTTSDVIYDIRLFNAQGFIVRRQQARTGRVEFDVSNLPEGTYYLHIDRNNEIEKIQIIVRRQ